MPIDTKLEELISLIAATQLLPARRRGKKPHISCLYRWTTTGCRGVVLESVMVGGTRSTSREALARFIERLSGYGNIRNPDQTLQVQAERLEQGLDEEGITMN